MLSGLEVLELHTIRSRSIDGMVHSTLALAGARTMLPCGLCSEQQFGGLGTRPDIKEEPFGDPETAPNAPLTRGHPRPDDFLYGCQSAISAVPEEPRDCVSSQG